MKDFKRAQVMRDGSEISANPMGKKFWVMPSREGFLRGSVAGVLDCRKRGYRSAILSP